MNGELSSAIGGLWSPSRFGRLNPNSVNLNSWVHSTDRRSHFPRIEPRILGRLARNIEIINGELPSVVISSRLHFVVSPSPNVHISSASLPDSITETGNLKSTQTKRQIAASVV